MKKICFETKKEINLNQLKELYDLLETQNTTDRNEPSEYVYSGEYGDYNYKIDSNYNIIVLDIE